MQAIAAAQARPKVKFYVRIIKSESESAQVTEHYEYQCHHWYYALACTLAYLGRAAPILRLQV